MKKIIKYIPHSIFFTVSLLLVLHTFNIGSLNIDNTTILLIVLLFIVPLSGSLKKIKFGDFEAEIQPAEVKKIETEVRGLPQDDSPRSHEIDNIVENIYSALENDHIMALAKLRIDLEKYIYKIIFTQEKKFHKKSLYSAIRYLENKKIIDKKVITPIKDVISICNRAIHGEDVKKKTAESIIDIGGDLLMNLHFIFTELKSKPTTSEEISSTQRDHFMNSKYHVTTVVPIVDGPYINRYVFNQEQLNRFLENYDEFAEFLTEIKKIDN
ncbi:hypothetical protein KAR28_01995 [Candidatus Parcubacteria bacterium]|nr:hypothetical protein [Candidatus Parcubacteria bacterium]